MKQKLTLTVLRDTFCVCRLKKGMDIPAWAFQSDWFSITRTDEELSIVCIEENIPSDILCERNWRNLKVEGPLDFSLTGILSEISNILAEKKISIFAISTYDTDYILVKEDSLDSAIHALRDSGYNINN